MNIDPFTIGLISSFVPCVLFYTKWKQEKRKFQIKEQMYRKMIEKAVALQDEKATEEQKILKQEEHLGHNVEYNMIDLLMKISKCRVRKICITGGPCAGKTTGLTFLQQKLQERGYAVFVVPEAATQIFLGGGMLDLDNYSKDGKTTFQMNLMNLQRRLEHTFTVLAMLCPSTKIPVLLCDRGLMDGKAYMESSQWYEMLAQYNLNEVEMRDLRYDAVIHMVTAADSTDCYSTLNNQARHETQEQALIMDQQTQMAWVGHPKYIKIDNHSIKSFGEKLNWLLFEVFRVLGHPIEEVPFGVTKAYLLSSTEKSTVEPTQIISQEQQSILLTTTYLISKSKSSRLKLIQRIIDGQMLHYIQEKILNQDKVIKVNSKIILKKEYAEFSTLADPNYQVIVRKRNCISYKGQYMVIDEYQDLDVKLSILKIQNSKDQAKTQFLPQIKIIRQLQPHEMKLFSCRHIAQRKDIQKISSEPLFMQFRKLSQTDENGSIEKKQRDQELPDEFHLDAQGRQYASPKKSQ